MASISAAWSRVTGRGAKTLPADLNRVTHSGVLDIPKELLTPIIEASNNEDDRPEIMKHIRECLCEPLGKNWRRIYGGMVLVEALMKNGSAALITETADGRHFDIIQRLSFLEHYDNTDKRVMNNIRKKAEGLRKEVVPLIQNAGSKDLDDNQDTISTCSPGAVSVITRSTTASSSTAAGFGSDDVGGDAAKFVQVEPAKRTMILNGIVTVGHNDDTTSESEGGEDKTHAAVGYREPRRMTAKARNERSRREQSNSSDSDDEPPKAPAHSMDLLGL